MAKTVRARVSRNSKEGTGSDGASKSVGSRVALRKKNKEAQGNSSGVSIANRGIKEVSDYTQSMIAIFTETLRGNITPQVCNAAVGAGSRAMRSVEMELRYGNEFRKTFRNHMSGVIDVESGAPVKASRRRKSVKP